MELKKSILKLIELEKTISNLPAKQEKLQEIFDKLSEEFDHSIESAEIIYSAKQNLDNHKKEIEELKGKMNQAEKNIISHLEILNGKQILYRHEYEDEQRRPTSNTYGFQLKDGKLVHNCKLFST